MPKISLMFEGQNGLYWPQWKRLVAEAEDLGFAGIFRSDHFTNPKPAGSAIFRAGYVVDLPGRSFKTFALWTTGRAGLISRSHHVYSSSCCVR